MTTPIARILLLAALFSGCGGSDSPTDAGPDSDVTACTTAADCDDGLYCNGAETCDADDAQADERGCVAAVSPCAVACDEAEDMCGGCDDDEDGDGARSVACGGNDCDDDDDTRFPGNLEACDLVDQDCNSQTVGDVDLDNDNQIDDACCNGATCGLDCDDQRPTVHRLASEVCDGFDNDCDGMTDEGLLVPSWPDLDEDLYGDADATPTMACSIPTGRVDNGGDCDESDEDIHPDTDELCNGIDDDCDEATDEGGATACETAFPGSVALCISGQCIITGCTGSRFDCNGSFTDGCEADVCSSILTCDGCGWPCFGSNQACNAGVCSPSRPMAESGAVLRDATTGEPIAGATITLIGTCETHTATTNEDGEYSLPHRSVSWARVTAAGYPTHIQLRNDDTGFGPIVSQAALDAFLATQDVTIDPALAIILADSHPEGNPMPILTTARGYTALYTESSELTPGTAGDQLLVNALPGRATIGGSQSNNGCHINCGPVVELMLEPGAVTLASGFSCTGVCD